MSDEDKPKAETTPEVEVDDTPLGALFKAADQAEKIKRVLIIFEREDGTYSSEDNGITMQEAVYMIECYRHWVMTSVFRPRDSKD